jgi:hypothetical protein
MIDGQEAGTVRHGGQESFQVTPGTHEVFLEIDWCRNPKLKPTRYIDTDLAA